MQKISTLLIIMATVISCHKSTPQETTTPNVKVTYPQSGTVVQSYSFPATLAASQEVKLVARVSGTLDQVNYPSGGMVKKDSPLFTIEPQQYLDAVESSRAQVQSAEAQLEYAKSNYERMQRSSKNNAVSQNDLQQAKSAYLQAEASLNQAQSQLDEASLNLSYCYINAPFNGEITKNAIDAGNYLSGGETLATIYDEKSLTVQFNMSYNEYLNLPKQIDKIEAYIIANGDTIPARISYIAPAVTTQTGTLAIEATINNTQNRLKSGAYTTIVIPWHTNKNAVIIPETSVGRSLDQKYVYTLNSDNTVNATSVKTGATLPDGMIEITEGLSHNQLYLIDALSAIRPGMKINPITIK